MKRFTTDNPQNNTETMHNMLFPKDGQVWVRAVGENGEDVTLCDWTRQLCAAHGDGCNDVAPGAIPEDFTEAMMMCLFSAEPCPIANVHMALVGACENRSLLKRYEDTGYSYKGVEDMARAKRDDRVAPCRPGDNVYMHGWGEVIECEVVQVSLGNEGWKIHYNSPFDLHMNPFRKNACELFFTREEAEAALREMTKD